MGPKKAHRAEGSNAASPAAQKREKARIAKEEAESALEAERVATIQADPLVLRHSDANPALKVSDIFNEILKRKTFVCREDADADGKGNPRRTGTFDWSIFKEALAARNAESPTWFVHFQIEGGSPKELHVREKIEVAVVVEASEPTLAPMHMVYREARPHADVEDNPPERVIGLDELQLCWREARADDGAVINVFVLQFAAQAAPVFPTAVSFGLPPTTAAPAAWLGGAALAPAAGFGAAKAAALFGSKAPAGAFIAEIGAATLTLWTTARLNEMRKEIRAGSRIVVENFPLPAPVNRKIKLQMQNDMKGRISAAAEAVIRKEFARLNSDIVKLDKWIDECPIDDPKLREVIAKVREPQPTYETVATAIRPIVTAKLEQLVSERKKMLDEEVAAVQNILQLLKKRVLLPRHSYRVVKYYPEASLEASLEASCENEPTPPNDAADVDAASLDPTLTEEAMSFSESTLPHLVPIRLLPTFAAMAGSLDPLIAFHGVLMIRKLLSVGWWPPIREVVETRGVVKLLVGYLTWHDWPEMQLQAAKAVSTIASGTLEDAQLLIEHGAALHLVSLLESEDDQVREQAARAVERIAGKSDDTRAYIIDIGGPVQLINAIKMSFSRDALLALSKLCCSMPPETMASFNSILPDLPNFLNASDPGVMRAVCAMIVHICEAWIGSAERVVQTNIVRAIVDMLKSDNQRTAAMSVLARIAAVDDICRQTIIDNGALKTLRALLHVDRVGVCNCLAEICAGNSDQIQSIIDVNLFPVIIELMHGPANEAEVKKAALRCIANATKRGTATQLSHLVGIDVVQFLCQALYLDNSDVALETLLKYISFKEGERDPIAAVLSDLRRRDAPQLLALFVSIIRICARSD